MKRGHLWVDWVELGCRGWEIDQTGAELVDGDSFAHLDRTTLDLAFGGGRKHFAQVVNDLRGAGIFVLLSAKPALEWPSTLTAGTGTAGSTDTIAWSVNIQGWGEEQPNGMMWTHPGGATLTLTNPPKVEGRFRRWVRTAREAYLAVMLESFARWFREYQRLAKHLSRAA